MKVAFGTFSNAKKITFIYHTAWNIKMQFKWIEEDEIWTETQKNGGNNCTTKMMK